MRSWLTVSQLVTATSVPMSGLSCATPAMTTFAMWDSSDLASLPKNCHDDKLKTLLGQGRVARSARAWFDRRSSHHPAPSGHPPQRGGDNYPCCSPNSLPPPSA